MTPIRRVTAQTVDVLVALLDEPDPVWGLLLAKRSGRTPAAVYAILSRLESGGWLEADWENDSDRTGPRRRLYRLTDAGRGGAAAVTADFRRRDVPSARTETRPA